jgi:uncharacterized membrane protein YhaH (DUF805 family)
MSATSVPLSQPLYGATLGQAVSRFFRKYATFTGRASRSEYWWMALALFLITLVPSALLTVGLVSGITHHFGNLETYYSEGADGTTVMLGGVGPGIFSDPTAALLIPLGAGLLSLIWLATLVPSLALSWRRLHDAGLAGPWYFLTLIAGVGGLFLLVLMLQPSKPEGRRFDAPETAPAI